MNNIWVKNICRLVIVVIALFTITACSPVKIPSQNSYMLALPSAQPTTTPVVTSGTQTLLISRPQAAAGYNTAKMAYMLKPYQLQYFTKNKWVDDPADMLLPLMVQAIQNTHKFGAVVGSPFSGYSDYRLDTTLVALQQNFTTTPNQEQLVINARLVQTATQRIIATRQFAIQMPTAQNTPYAGVQAANQAVALYLDQLQAFVGASLGS